jgi:crotonobetainyl-CoA:carnitine CoA-transferase CaiB-like acyl-CoA transferase
MGAPAWAADARFATAAGRVAHRADLDRLLGAWTATLADREVMARLQAAGVPAGKLMYVRDITADPHLAARGYARPLDQPGVGPMWVEGPGFRASTLADPVTGPAPFLGEHSRPVLREHLGLTDAEVDALVAAGVVVEAPPPP